MGPRSIMVFSIVPLFFQLSLKDPKVRHIFHCVCVYLTLLIVPATAQYTISTIAGGVSGDGTLATSRFIPSPRIALDPSGNLYFASLYENRVYKLNTNGTLTLVAGNGSQGFSG